MTKHIHVHLIHDAMSPSTSTQKSSGGVTTWGGGDPKKVVPKSPIDELRKKSKDAGTSEGAKKAAQTRKAHGGGFNHTAEAEKHQKMAGTSRSGSPESQAHYAAAAAHRKAATNPAHAEAAHAASAKVANASKHFKAKGMYEATPSAVHWEKGLQGVPKGYNPKAGGYSK